MTCGCEKLAAPELLAHIGCQLVDAYVDVVQKDIILDFSRSGKPTDNAFIESFNGKFRAECLKAHWFMGLDDARTKMEVRRRDYNEVRAHSAIGNEPPISLQYGSGNIGPP